MQTYLKSRLNKLTIPREKNQFNTLLNRVNAYAMIAAQGGVEKHPWLGL